MNRYLEGGNMSIIYESEVPNPNTLFVRDPNPQICEWQGRKALQLSGQGASLLIVPDLHLAQGWIEVDMGADGAAYPGIAFHVLDSLNYELAYIQPHTSGQWDALQYDPVFHGSNTWQLYYGVGAQQHVEVPPKTWLHLRIEFQDQRALIQVGTQEPLLVNQLAHHHNSGLVGLWTFLPAYFSNLRFGDDAPDFLASMPLAGNENSLAVTVTEWFMEGFGVIQTEENGILNLNRYLPLSETEVRLVREVEVQTDGNFTFNVGFSDQLTLQIDDEVVFKGENLYQNSPKWEERGYVKPDQQIECFLHKGIHRLTAILKAMENFGFGIALNIEGDGYRLLPAQLCR
jgi:hypothetical protein